MLYSFLLPDGTLTELKRDKILFFSFVYLDNYYQIPIGSAPDLVLVKAFFDDGWIMDAQGKHQIQ